VLVPQITGTPDDIADQMKALFREEACDGFMNLAIDVPGAFRDSRPTWCRIAARRLFRAAYTGATLREHLALPSSS